MIILNNFNLKQQQSMHKKLKYGNKSKQKSNNNANLDCLKQGDEVTSAILSGNDPAYNSYLEKLIGNTTKTPSKNKKESTNLEKLLGDLPKNKETSPKKIQENYHNTQQQIKDTTINKYRNKSHGKGLSAKDEINHSRIPRMNRSSRVHEHTEYGRFPTQEAELERRVPKYDQTSLICCSDEEEGQSIENKNFLQGIDEYVAILEANGSSRKNEKKDRKKRICNLEDDIRNTEEILNENVKLRKKLKKYQKIIDELHESAESHLKYCRKRQKTNKSKTNDLIRSLAQAVTKINEQKQQIDSMKRLFKKFGKKAQQYTIMKEQQSSDPEDYLNQELMRGIRLSRPHSQDKAKRKKGFEYNFQQYLYQRD